MYIDQEKSGIQSVKFRPVLRRYRWFQKVVQEHSLEEEEETYVLTSLPLENVNHSGV